MAMNYIPLDKDKHKDLKVAVNNSFKFAENTHLSAASIREFPQLASCMPIVFIQDPQTERFHAVAMLGIEQNKNLYVHEGKWQAPHVPWNIARFPFDVRPDGDKLGVFIDENSDLVGTEEGLALFTEAGEPSEYLQNRQQFLAELANSEITTQKFIQKVKELDLLDPIQIRVSFAQGQPRAVTGMFSISEKKLLALPDETVLDLHKNGYLGAIYSVMMSLGQLSRLIDFSNNSENPIQNMQIGPANVQTNAEQQTEEAPQA